MEQLRLERFTYEDIPRLISWLDSPEVFWNWTADFLVYPLTVEQYARRVAETKVPEPNRLIFKAVVVGAQMVAGQFEISTIDRVKSTATIGRVIVNPAMRGQGICKAMISLGVSYARDQLEINHLDIQVAEQNTEARRCYERAGFVDDGPMWEDKRRRWMSQGL